MDFRNSFYNIISKSDKIVITSHHSLDDDAIGSCMSMYQVLKEKYPSKVIDMVISGQRLIKYKYFKFYKDIIFVNDFSEVIKKYDCLILLDGGQYARFTKLPEVISEYQRENKTTNNKNNKIRTIKNKKIINKNFQ